MLIDCIKEFMELRGQEYCEKYGITEKHLESIIRSPFKFMKLKIDDGKLDIIRLKYFGSLRIYQGTAKGFLYKITKKKERGYLKEEEYEKMKEKIIKIIK